MSTMTIAKKYVELCKDHQNHAVLETLFSPDAVSVEAGAPPGASKEVRGLKAVAEKGKTSDDWLHDEVYIHPHMHGPLDYAIRRYRIPRPQGTEGRITTPFFNLELWSPFAGLSSVFDQDRLVNAGFADGAWRPAASPDGSFAAPAEVMQPERCRASDDVSAVHSADLRTRD